MNAARSTSFQVEVMEHKFGPIVFIPGDNSGNYPNCNSLYVEGDVRILIDPASQQGPPCPDS